MFSDSNKMNNRPSPKSKQQTVVTPPLTPAPSSKLDNNVLNELLIKKFNNHIITYANGIKTIDGINIIEQFYHAYLADNRRTCNKKQLKRAIYNYILKNNLKVIGGKFDKTYISIMLFYYW